MESGCDSVDGKRHHTFEIFFRLANQHHVLGDDGLAGHKPYSGVEIDPRTQLPGGLCGFQPLFEHIEDSLHRLMDRGPAFLADGIVGMEASACFS